MAVATTTAPEVIRPGSSEELVESFGDGANAVVLGGGTVLVPELVYRKVRPQRVVLLPPGLDTVERGGGEVTIGAGVRVSELEDGDEPLATAARHLADPEIRGQATVGGNLCVQGGETPARRPPGSASRPRRHGPHGRLGRRADRAARGLPRSRSAGRVVLDVSYEEAERQTGYAAVTRPHAHHYTILAVAAARRDGETRVAVTGAGPTALRLPSVESGGSPADALNDVDPPDDALASSWYRRRVLPGLVERALSSFA